MLIILVSWIYILLTTINLGVVVSRMFRISPHFSVTAFIGLFATSMLASAWAFFDGLSWGFDLFFLGLNVVVSLIHRPLLLRQCSKFRNELLSLKTPLKILIGFLSLLILAQCASAPYAFDNESYYIQTIKWLEEYGFVKGVANLHIFLGQTSGWHIAQSAFNFTWLSPNLNDLSGFSLLLGNLFAICNLNDYFKDRDKNYLVFGLLPIANLLLFPFISAPSPDVPVYILTLIIAYYVVKRDRLADNFNSIALLVLFALYIKPTAVALVLIPLVHVYQFRRNVFRLIPISILGCVVLTLFIFKNKVITGYPLFPITSLALSENHVVPKVVVEDFYTITKLFAYKMNKLEFDSSSAAALFVRWLTLPKLHGLFNCLSILLIMISPIVIWKRFNSAGFWLLYFTMSLQMLVLFASSPQYRFFLNFILIFGFMLIAITLKSERMVILIVYSASAACLLFLLFSWNLKPLTNNKFGKRTAPFSVENVLYPHENSKLALDYETVYEGNLQYHSPVNAKFRYLTGDGKLPCVKASQIRYYKRKFGVVPQLRSGDLRDGFYSKGPRNE
ncbi:MAG TPA: hypothetical protein VF676_00420 [Flavobacterium sp.]|jgi:hypothetical protein